MTTKKDDEMELVTLVAIIAIVIVLIIGAITAIRKVFAFYKQRFHFSLLSGVLLFVLSLSLVTITGTAEMNDKLRYTFLAVSIILIILTGYNDFRLAGIGWGLLAVGIQAVISLCFVFLILLAVVGFILKKVFKIHSSILNSIFGASLNIRNELAALAYFLHP